MIALYSPSTHLDQPSQKAVSTLICPWIDRDRITTRNISSLLNFDSVPGTTSGRTTLHESVSPERTQTDINELKRLSGLTWSQLAGIFSVSSRTLHSWASGERIRSQNQEKLSRVLGTIKHINQGCSDINRSLLLQVDPDTGRSSLDLLAEGEYVKVKEILGAGSALPPQKMGALSEEESRLRAPLSPEILANPLPEISYHQTGKSRPARTARNQGKRSGQ
jgi:DNA-binding transcriptional regulator YiaG